MSFWNKENKEEAVKRVELGRNDPCHCGSGKKYKKCCIEKDQTAERKTLDANWEKAAAAAKDKEEKDAKAAKENPTAPNKFSGNSPSVQQKHQKFVPSQVSTPRKSGGG